MKIELHRIPIRDIVDNFEDKDEEGIFGYGGRLNIRPPYQREFIYDKKQRDAVIATVQKGFPLNVMYWAVQDGGEFEVIDGQQRTLSICNYVKGNFSINNQTFHNLPVDKQKQILDYELEIYFCSGSKSEKLEWFEIVYTAGVAWTKQELRNAVYAGPWLTDAKRYFSKNNCLAFITGQYYIKGTPIRQDYLETALRWASKGNIENYMSKHQHDKDAIELWAYFGETISWIEKTFPPEYNKNRSKFMKGIDWGTLYDQFKDKMFDPDELEKEIQELILDDDVTCKRGIYPYVLTRNEKYLSIRNFTTAVKMKVYEKQGGICPLCGEHFELDEMEADHIIPWHDGGKTLEENCQLLCVDCNRKKAGK